MLLGSQEHGDLFVCVLGHSVIRLGSAGVLALQSSCRE